MIVGVNISVIIREKEEAKTQRRLLMVKTKSDVEKILDKIEGEIQTAKTSCVWGVESEYWEGKEQALSDLKTWIQENILET
jgi:hypothetical protein